MIEFFRNLLRRRKERKTPSQGYRIAFDEGGFSLAHAGKSQGSDRLEWASVQKAVAFKRDLWTVDMVCLALETRDSLVLELNEEMVGWQEYIEALPKHLDGARPCAEWFPEVVVPAFKTNSTLVFERSSRHPEAGR